MSEAEQPPINARQRLDKWLFFARMAKSRSIAQDYIQSGAVRVNDLLIKKPSYEVKVGDRLDIRFERMDRILIVKDGGERRGPYEEARLLYEDKTPPREKSDVMTPFEQAQRAPGAGRPTKKERRAIDRLISDFPDSVD